MLRLRLRPLKATQEGSAMVCLPTAVTPNSAKDCADEISLSSRGGFHFKRNEVGFNPRPSPAVRGFAYRPS